MSARNHSYYQDLLELHISGEPLSPDDRLSLFDHIEDCDECREMLEAESRITARMKSVPRLVAPVDLRSKILSQAMRDHRERTTTPSEDPNIADLLKARTVNEESIDPGHPAAPRVPDRRLADQSDTAPAEPRRVRRNAADDFPVFAGILRPAPSRLRRVWRKASPVLATMFLVVAGLGALYSGQFQGIPVAGEAQGLLFAAVDAVMKPGDAANQTGPPPVKIAQKSEIDNSRWQRRPAAEDAQAINHEAMMLTHPPDAALPSKVIQTADSAPLPGTQQVVTMMRQMRSWGAAADSTMAALTAAASEPVPAPAEQSTPQIAALVLRATDRDNSAGGFRDSALAEVLEDMTRIQPGGRIARQDQFAMDGHRYRLYTLELPAGFTDEMVASLMPYQTQADGVVVNALISQDSIDTQRGGAVQFYSSNEARLRSALQTIRPVAGKGRSERVRVVVVE